MVNAADLAGSEQIADDLSRRHIARPHGFGEENALFPRRTRERLGLGDVDGEGFLAQDAASVGQAEQSVLEMARVRRGDVDQTDLVVARQLLVAAVGDFKAEVLGESFCFGRVARGYRPAFDAGHLRERARHGLRDLSGTPDPDFHRWNRPFLVDTGDVFIIA